jgi:hypothetical protein
MRSVNGMMISVCNRVAQTTFILFSTFLDLRLLLAVKGNDIDKRPVGNSDIQLKNAHLSAPNRELRNDCVSAFDYCQVVLIERASALEVGVKSKGCVWRSRRYIGSVAHALGLAVSENITITVAVET